MPAKKQNLDFSPKAGWFVVWPMPGELDGVLSSCYGDTPEEAQRMYGLAIKNDGARLVQCNITPVKTKRKAAK